MAKFLCQVQYSAAAFKGMLTKPTDRNTAAAALFTAIGIKVPDFHYSVSRGGIVCIVECTTEQFTSLAMVMNASGGFRGPIVTEIVPAVTFYPAEDYHQNYYAQNGEQGYCQMVIRPKLDKFRKAFATKLKP